MLHLIAKVYSKSKRNENGNRGASLEIIVVILTQSELVQPMLESLKNDRSDNKPSHPSQTMYLTIPYNDYEKYQVGDFLQGTLG